MGRPDITIFIEQMITIWQFAGEVLKMHLRIGELAGLLAAGMQQPWFRRERSGGADSW